MGVAIFDPVTHTRQVLSGLVPDNILDAWVSKQTYINQLELIAVLAAVLTFGQACLQGRDVIFFIDNTSVLNACVHGYVKDTDSDLASMSNLLHLALAQLQCTCWFELVNSAANIADLPTHPQDSGADYLYTLLSLKTDDSLCLPTLLELTTPRMHQLFSLAAFSERV